MESGKSGDVNPHLLCACVAACRGLQPRKVGRPVWLHANPRAGKLPQSAFVPAPTAWERRLRRMQCLQNLVALLAQCGTAVGTTIRRGRTCHPRAARRELRAAFANLEPVVGPQAGAAAAGGPAILAVWRSNGRRTSARDIRFARNDALAIEVGHRQAPSRRS